MPTYAALLGNNPQLSTAELAALLPDFAPKRTFGQFLVFETGSALDQAFLARLGGTIVLAKGLSENKKGEFGEVPMLLKASLAKGKGKLTFSLRLAGVDREKGRHLFRDSKNHLKHHNVPSRYVGSEREAAKPVQVHDEGLLDPTRGAELVVLAEKHEVWIGQTVGAQDIKSYTQRDMEKPVRDTTVGLLPPKLAQMLLNFGVSLVHKKSKDAKITVLDPFCGTGVIPLEAMLIGWDVLASDVSDKAVNGCSKNIEWARKALKIAKKDSLTTVTKHDATKPFEFKELPTIVVTEGTLGPALKSRSSVKDAEAHAKKVDDIVCRFLENCSKTLPGVSIVMTWPVWYAQKRQVMLEKAQSMCHKLGYTPTLPPHANPAMAGRMSLLYRRTDQFVGREIVMLMAKK